MTGLAAGSCCFNPLGDGAGSGTMNDKLHQYRVELCFNPLGDGAGSGTRIVDIPFREDRGVSIPSVMERDRGLKCQFIKQAADWYVSIPSVMERDRGQHFADYAPDEELVFQSPR